MKDPTLFAIFRSLFGVYLALHFAMLAPYAAELFGVNGILPDPSLNPTYGLFPNPLNFPLTDPLLTGLLWALVGVSVLFAAGVWRPGAALLLWFGWTALFHRNNLISNPSLPYIGLLLILCALVPAGEAFVPGRVRDPTWRMPVWIPRCAWILMGVGYTFSGLTKLGSPSWMDGSALVRLLENPLARPGPIRDSVLQLPPILLRMGSWSILILEIACAPLFLWKNSRPWVWSALVCMHVGIVLGVDFADLSVGMLMIHLFAWPFSTNLAMGRTGVNEGTRPAVSQPAVSV